MAKKTAAAKSGANKTARKKKAASTAKAARTSAAKTRKKTAARATAARKSSPKKRTVAKAPSPAKTGAKGTIASKKRIKAAKTPATTATSQDPIQFPEQRRRPPKTHLSAKELREFKELLLSKRAELCGDVEQLANDGLNSKAQGNTEHSAMPIHMADLGSDNWEKEFTLGLIANEQTRVREIDEALGRIRNRTYGICLATHNEISRARLRAKPWAEYCIEHAKAREEGRVP